MCSIWEIQKEESELVGMVPKMVLIENEEVCVCCFYVCLCIPCMQWPQRPEEGVGPETGVTGSRCLLDRLRFEPWSLVE